MSAGEQGGEASLEGVMDLIEDDEGGDKCREHMGGGGCCGREGCCMQSDC